jgi:hypothetical protein
MQDKNGEILNLVLFISILKKYPVNFLIFFVFILQKH